jgi:hypothetical protein
VRSKQDTAIIIWLLICASFILEVQPAASINMISSKSVVVAMNGNTKVDSALRCDEYCYWSRYNAVPGFDGLPNSAALHPLSFVLFFSSDGDVLGIKTAEPIAKERPDLELSEVFKRADDVLAFRHGSGLRTSLGQGKYRSQSSHISLDLSFWVFPLNYLAEVSANGSRITMAGYRDFVAVRLNNDQKRNALALLKRRTLQSGFGFGNQQTLPKYAPSDSFTKHRVWELLDRTKQ